MWLEFLETAGMALAGGYQTNSVCQCHYEQFNNLSAKNIQTNLYNSWVGWLCRPKCLHLAFQGPSNSHIHKLSLCHRHCNTVKTQTTSYINCTFMKNICKKTSLLLLAYDVKSDMNHSAISNYTECTAIWKYFRSVKC